MIRTASAALAAAVLTSAAQAAVVTTGASNWNTLIQTTDGSLSNGGDDSIFAGSTAQGSLRRGLLKFNVGAVVPTGAAITGVTLRLRLTRTAGGEQVVGLNRVLKAWGQGTEVGALGGGQGAPSTSGTATWLHTFYNTQFWDTPGGDFVTDPSSTEVVSGLGYYIFTGTGLATDVQSWLDDPSSNAGWMVIGNEFGSGTAQRFASGSHSTANYRPLLTITYTIPSPAAAGLLGLAAVAVGSRRRR